MTFSMRGLGKLPKACQDNW